MMQSNISNILCQAFATLHAAHAYIVVGEKAQLPQLLKSCAAVCMCQNHTGEDGCENCHKVKNCLHQDVLWFPKDQTRTRLNVADMQTLVDETFKRPVDTGESRVFLVNAADSVTGIGCDVWQNKLLKTLEEPTPNTYIFIGVTDAESLLPTVRSRCQVLKQNKLSVFEVCVALQQKGYEKSLCEVAAAASNGNVETAEAIFANPAILRAFDNAADMLQNMSSTKNALPFVSAVLAEKETVNWFLHFLTLLLGESICYRLTENLCMLPSHAKTVEKICQNYSLAAAEVCIEKIAYAKSRLDDYGNLTVVLDKLVSTLLEVKYRCRI